ACAGDPARRARRSPHAVSTSRLLEVLIRPDLAVRHLEEATGHLGVLGARHVDVVAVLAERLTWAFVPHRLQTALNHLISAAPAGTGVLRPLPAVSNVGVSAAGRVGLGLLIGARLGLAPALVGRLALRRPERVDSRDASVTQGVHGIAAAPRTAT